MSLGVSIGDFLAGGKLIADITSCLKEVGGSKAEYRGVVLELEGLQKALTHLDRLQPCGDRRNVDVIKYAALSCRRPLEDFLAKLKRFEESLGPRATGSSWKAPVEKVRFLISHGSDIWKMQSYLSVHVGIINIVLAEHGLETMNIAHEKTQSEQLGISERLDTTKEILIHVRDSVVKQAAAVYSAGTLLERLYSLVSGEIHTSLRGLVHMAAAAW